jgi:hypothetical protein
VEISQLFDRFGGYVSVAALVAVLLLIPLYLSQRRDVRRMRDWMQREPEHPGADLAASETLLDRAEAELEELIGAAQPGATPATALTAAARVTHERPALERITMERAALEPHPRWRRFVATATQPRVLVAVALGALVLGVGGIFLSEALLQDSGGGARKTPAAAIDPADVKVAVLNGTSVGGLAGRVGSDVASSGFELGAVTSTDPGAEKTTVLYADGQKAAAQKVARKLGVDDKFVAPLDRDTRRLAGDADVVVIAGLDRAS